MNYEEALNQLESLIVKMETGKLSLEDSLKNFEEGVKLAAHCQKALKEAEQKVQILIEKNGAVKQEDFALADET